MMGRATIHLSPADFMAVLRGAGKLYVLVQKVEPPMPLPTTADQSATITWTFQHLIATFRDPVYEPIDLFGLRMVDVEYDATCDTVAVALSGPGLPDWQPGNYPEELQCRVDITALDPPEPPPSRRFDLSDE